ncbi:MAG: carboxypeptidase regulatory-like domain-containing protein [Thermodesulfovibrionia bacterium]|nr:carboxypeptidase regulatory-like domain-containing protein [Thermodesulfovibrionia bacterium]
MDEKKKKKEEIEEKLIDRRKFLQKMGRYSAIAAFALSSSSFLLQSCGSDGGGETPRTTVSGTVLDANGDPVSGAQVTISSDPVTATADSDGNFSCEVEVGEHSMEIAVGDVSIYSGTITCIEGESLLLGTINTSYNYGDYSDWTNTYSDWSNVWAQYSDYWSNAWGNWMQSW